MNPFSHYSAIIEEAIDSLPLKDTTLPGLYLPIAYGLEAGGKRLRPTLALIACQATCGTPTPAVPAALAVEMFHNFTLLHDDVMDNSDTRRGRPTVHRQWDINTAILSGDTLLSLAVQTLCQLPDSALRPALQCFNTHTIQVYEGQQMDMDFETRKDVTLPQYLEMIRLKTSVLLGCAAKLGAIAGAATPMQADLWYRFGEDLGLAFQIQDDYLDLYGDPTTFGKPIGGDILNNKKTFLLLSALQTPIANEVQTAMAMTPSPAKIDTVRSIFDRADIPTICRKAITHYTDSALQALASLHLPTSIHKALTDYTNQLASRTK